MFVCEEGSCQNSLQTVQSFQNPKHLIKWYEKMYHTLDREDRSILMSGGEIFRRFQGKLIRIRKN